MKFTVTLSLVAFIIICTNNAVLAEKINDDKVDTVHSHRKPIRNHLRTNAIGRKKSKLKLSKQLAEAKKKCWDGNYIFTRVINGSNATKDTLPWMVAIFDNENNYTSLYCGGAIISTKFMLTAAHCFQYTNKTMMKLSDLIVRYGMHDLMTENYVERKIVKVHMAKYKIGFNDIAVAKLSHRVTYSDIINPICVPGLTTPSFWDQWAEGHAVLISGWGQYKTRNTPPGEKYPKTLQKGFGYIVNSRVCYKLKIKFDHSTNICIGSTSKESKLCHGDSGSPVIPLTFLLGKDSFVFPVAIGVVSFGDDPCNGPAVLTKLESFISWINKVTFNE